MQWGLTVLFHRHFGSRYLIDTLNRLGVCSSYRDVLRFESCSAQQHGVNLYDVGNESFLHYIGDNVDHNVNTLDGLNTFHGMGIIASVTPGNKSHTSLPIKRVAVSSKDVIDTAKIELKYFTFHQNINLVDKFEPFPPVIGIDNTKMLGNLWQYAWLVKPMKPCWNGFMKSTHSGTIPGKSAVHFMPMINMKATAYSCIYSTMLFASKQADKYSHDAVLTFDQPLCWAMEIKSCQMYPPPFMHF